jgi:hypothetical protein
VESWGGIQDLLQDLLQDFSREPRKRGVRAGALSRTLALTWCFSVGVAGFEPAASSSRIRPWKIDYLRITSKVQVNVLVCVGLTRCSEAAISRSSPGFLQRPTEIGYHARRTEELIHRLELPADWSRWRP